MSQARNSGIGGAHTRLLHPAARKFVKVPALSRAMLPNPSHAVLSIQITESLSLSLSAVLQILRGGVWRRDAPLNLHHPLS